MTVHRDTCAIVGVGETDYTSASGRSVLSLATEAALAAIADAGLRPDDIDGIIRSDYDTVQHNDLMHSLGIPRLDYWSIAGFAGAAPCAMLGQAVAAIMAGLATNVLVFRALNGRSGLRYGKGTSIQQAGAVSNFGGGGTYDEYFLPYGLLAPGQLYAMIARRHMIEFGTTPQGLASIATTARQRANQNPHAQMHARSMTREDYFNARMISDPLRLFDFTLETDGACAFVVSRSDRAADMAQPPVLVRAVAQGAGEGIQGGKIMPSLMRPTITTQPSKVAAETLWSRAGLGPGDMDVVQLYDCFTITVLLQLEDYGFCEKGEGGDFAASGALDLDGSLPFNTAGGNLSEGYLHGVNHIVEGVRQMRGTSTSQVDNAETCLVTSGIPISTSAAVLRRAS